MNSGDTDGDFRAAAFAVAQAAARTADFMMGELIKAPPSRQKMIVGLAQPLAVSLAALQHAEMRRRGENASREKPPPHVLSWRLSCVHCASFKLVTGQPVAGKPLTVHCLHCLQSMHTPNLSPIAVSDDETIDQPQNRAS